MCCVAAVITETSGGSTADILVANQLPGRGWAGVQRHQAWRVGDDHGKRSRAAAFRGGWERVPLFVTK